MSKLHSAHLGNGLAIWREGEDNWLGHISADRIPSYREDATEEEKAWIANLAKTDDRNISVSQDQKVFNERPKL